MPGRLFALEEVTEMLGALATAEELIRGAGHDVITQVSYRTKDEPDETATHPAALVIHIRIVPGDEPGGATNTGEAHDPATND